MDGAQNNNAKLAGQFLAAILGLLLLYLLSVGPVALILEKTPSMRNRAVIETVNIIYAPVIRMDQNPIFHKWIEAYLNLWGAH